MEERVWRREERVRRREERVWRRGSGGDRRGLVGLWEGQAGLESWLWAGPRELVVGGDRKSTRLNSSH